MKKITAFLFFGVLFFGFFLFSPKNVFASYCPNTVCETGEDCYNCSADCGQCPTVAPTPLPPDSGCTEGLCGILAGCDCYQNPKICKKCPGTEHCDTKTCPDGKEAWLMCVPDCTSPNKTCYESPSCITPLNCNDYGGDAYCQSLVPNMGCGPDPSSCMGVERCAVGGNCYIDCSGCLNQYHYACQSTNCVLIAGAGVDACTSNAECNNPIYHSHCISQACVRHSGAGVLNCQNDSDCVTPGGIAGHVTKTGTNTGIAGVQIQVYNSDINQTRTTITDASGYWKISNFVSSGQWYAVRVTGNQVSPKTAPLGYLPPAKTSTAGWTWINCGSPKKDTPLGSGSYECQIAGAGNDCAGPNGSGVIERCNFTYDPCIGTSPVLPPVCGGLETNGNQATMSWNPATSWGYSCYGADNHYKFYFADNYNGDNDLEEESESPYPERINPTSPLSKTVGPLLAEQTYYWQVEANNGELGSKSLPVCSFIIRSDQPWFQTTGGDIHSQGDITSLIPNCADDKNLSLPGDGGTTGVVSYGGDLYLQPAGLVSWQAKTAYDSAEMKFDYLLKRLTVDTTNVLPGSGDTRAIPSANGIYYLDAAGISLNGRAITSGEKIVIFVTGNVTVKNNITVANGGFFALIVRGNIAFSGVSSEVVKKAQGFFLADGAINILTDSPPDQDFEGQGSFVGWEGINLTRNLGPGNQNCTPAETFVERPDFFINAPDEFKLTNSYFKEVEP